MVLLSNKKNIKANVFFDSVLGNFFFYNWLHVFSFTSHAILLKFMLMKKKREKFKKYQEI